MDPIVLIPITLIFAVAIFLGRNELVKRKLDCPHKGEVADVGVVQRFQRENRPVRVKHCSLLPEQKRVDCDQACLKHEVTETRRSWLPWFMPGSR